MIEHNCKRLYLHETQAEQTQDQAEQAQDQAEQAQDQAEQAQAEQTQAQSKCGGEGVEPPVKSVFAKFKKYNTGVKGTNYSSDHVEQTTHFRYKGKLYQYEELLKQKSREKINTIATLDYAAYKLLMQAKKEN